MTSPITPLFTAHATATGGRNGHSEASDGSVSVDLSIPKEMGGPGKDGTTTPEHLFAVGYAACFCSALEFVARGRKVDVTGLSITADVTIGSRPEGGFGLMTTLTAHLPGHDLTAATELVEAAHQVCPYSNATRGNMPVDLKVTT
jgi:lipoyl-dependent peroxiredoxin